MFVRLLSKRLGDSFDFFRGPLVDHNEQVHVIGWKEFLGVLTSTGWIYLLYGILVLMLAGGIIGGEPQIIFLCLCP